MIAIIWMENALPTTVAETQEFAMGRSGFFLSPSPFYFIYIFSQMESEQLMHNSKQHAGNDLGWTLLTSENHWVIQGTGELFRVFCLFFWWCDPIPRFHKGSKYISNNNNVFRSHPEQAEGKAEHNAKTLDLLLNMWGENLPLLAVSSYFCSV